MSDTPDEYGPKDAPEDDSDFDLIRALVDTGEEKPMEKAAVRKLLRPFDPISADAEDQYDQVVRRVNRSRAKRAIHAAEREELERQFVEEDLRVQTGARRGLPLLSAGRRRRLNRLIELNVQDDKLREEERFADEALQSMNEALDRWARETYGG